MQNIEEVAEVILDGNIEALKALASNPDSSVMKVWMAKAAATGIQKGDLTSLEVILSRILGRPRTSVDVAMDPDKATIRVVIEDYTKK